MNSVLCTVTLCVLTSATFAVPADPTDPPPGTPTPTPDPDCPTGCKCDKNYSIINCKQLDQVPKFRDRSLVKELYISPNTIAELGAETLAGFTSLQHIDLSGGHIAKLHPDAFQDGKSTVTVINLCRNSLTAIPADTFKDFPKLLKLDISDNPIETLGNNALVNLPALAHLYIQHCGLAVIEPAAFQGISSLQELYLGRNNLHEIPFQALSAVPSIHTLNLSFNKIVAVPDTVPYGLPNLTNVALDSNELSFNTFPNVSSALKILDLSYTSLTSFSAESWKYIPSLENLDLGGLNIPEIKQGMFHGLPNLKHIYIKSSKYIKSIGKFAFDGLSSLKLADLSHNPNLTSVHVTAFSNTSLKTLFLDNTGLVTFQADLAPWSKMENVNLMETPLVCDCRIAWMLNSSVTGTYSSVVNPLKSVKCNSPPLLADKRVGTLSSRSLCGYRGSNSSLSRTAIGLIAASICTFVSAIFLMLIKCRHRIRASVRRYFRYRRYQNDMVFMVENDTSIGELEDSDAKPMKEMRLETVALTD